MIITGLLLIMCACGQENMQDAKMSSNHQANVDKKTESDGSSRLRKRQIDTMTMMPNRAQKISKIKSVRTIPVSVTNVYEPSRIEASPNEILELVFTRTQEGMCNRYVTITGSDKKYELIMKQPIKVPVQAGPSGIISFQCGMNMMKGQIVVVGR